MNPVMHLSCIVCCRTRVTHNDGALPAGVRGARPAADRVAELASSRRGSSAAPPVRTKADKRSVKNNDFPYYMYMYTCTHLYMYLIAGVSYGLLLECIVTADSMRHVQFIT